ncbi:MAG: ATP-dependent DNA helicase RecG [Bacteroidetes bacterium GWF2_33_16]|nr:MAG: ATP-dependent DNA helicase RecG [Bacteroidetes bacterium GWE2_32_14]OFY02786.1 MAG: ATP-dependent DNA helicase RecG [Bacteroidetes bacterium GWF2_33_16]
MSDYLQQEIKFLSGVGPKRAELLNKELQVYTFEDLLYYFPYKYIDKSKLYTISELNTELPYIQIQGKIIGFQTIGGGNKKRLVAQFADNTGKMELIWFKGLAYIQKSLQMNHEYIVFGKPAYFSGKYSIIHPEVESAAKNENAIQASLQAHYNTSEKLKNNFLTSRAISKLINNLMISLVGKIDETLPYELMKKYKLISLGEALFNIHFPQSTELLKNATYRLKFEELFYIQLNILQRKTIRTHKSNGLVFSKVGDYLNLFYKNNLPFELTDAQKRVLKEIRKDIGSGKQMNRLLQGDVGSGKTLVAMMSMLIALDNGYQACIMAPTEILANQHFETIKNFLKDLPVTISLLSGSTKTSARREIHKDLISGQLQILIGTHALIEDAVKFKNVGLVVIDEQHKFGVAQRAKLWKKNLHPPHILVMTATPIPRTLAMTIYGDLDVSVIDELPPGRKPIQTIHLYDSKRLRMFGFISQQIEEGRQIYIVYPLIKESEKMDYKDLEDGYESISRAFPPPKYAVSIVHGQMKPEEKEAAMNLFVRGQTHIMVATTVIEVGVNVQNASVMVIESAERFGLSQLHQLRGRVGRGADQSYCILMSSYKLSNEARKRIEIMTSTNDGFEIADADLKLRGPGDMEGTQQSGLAFDLKIANLAHDGQLIQYVRNIAEEILDSDPMLEKQENQILAKKLKKILHKKVDFSVIS